MHLYIYTEELLLELIQDSSTNITLSDDYPNTPIIASLYILPTPVTLYSMEFTMTIQDLEDGTVAGKCALVWLSTELTPVLKTNIVTRYKYRHIKGVKLALYLILFSSSSEAKYLAHILTINNRTHLSSYERFSQKGVPVSAVVTVSTTPCTVTRAAVNVSTTEVFDSDKGM